MRFEPLELHGVDALGQQEVPDYFQQPAKAITEDVSVMKGPDALEWIQAVREEIESCEYIVYRSGATKPYRLSMKNGLPISLERIVLDGNA